MLARENANRERPSARSRGAADRRIAVKVCFFAPAAYGYFRPERASWAGGAEVQQILIARRLQARGTEVSFIVGDHGQSDVEVVDGITLFKSLRLFAGNRKLRFIPDMLAIRRAMMLANADVYNQRSTAFYTGQLAYFASRLGRVFTFSAGSDYNAYPDCLGMVPRPMAMLYRYGIRRADAVIAQTEKQRRLMTENFGREVALIRNGIVIPEDAGAGNARAGGGPTPPPAVPRRPEFLWVGSFRRIKRPELVLELAARLPEATFTIIGGRGDNDPEYGDLESRVRSFPNVRFAGYVPPGDIERYYERAYAFVNTSTMEGFPNTYLHSWVHGVPVLTMEIDPDGIIADNRIGAVSRSLDGLAEAARRLCGNRAERDDMGRRALLYVRKNHDMRERGDEYLRLFERLLADRASGRS